MTYHAPNQITFERVSFSYYPDYMKEIILFAVFSCTEKSVAKIGPKLMGMVTIESLVVLFASPLLMLFFFNTL